MSLRDALLGSGARAMTIAPILSTDQVAQLRDALRQHFTSALVEQTLGLVGRAALARSDLAGAERVTRGDSPTATLIRLFMLGLPVQRRSAQSALLGWPVAEAIQVGLVEAGPEGAVRARLDLRPYSEADGPDWWVISDLAADVGGGPLEPEHVLGVGSAALTLAQATVRAPVNSALDIGTGCGIQALHLSRHARSVTATDLSRRALALAATTAALNGLNWDLRAGSQLDPVRGQSFDLVVSNPPFIVGPGFDVAPGGSGFRYRDSGLAGDGVCARLVREIPGVLSDGGTGQLLANWIIGAEEPWAQRLEGWLAGSRCDAWVWQREVADPGEYVALWLRDAGDTVGSPTWSRRYDDWLEWFQAAGVLGIGMGLVSLRRTGSADPIIVCEDVRQAIEQPSGAEVSGWFDRAQWLRERPPGRLGDQALLGSTLRTAQDLVLTRQALIGSDGWTDAVMMLRQSHGLRWEIEIDEAVAGVLAACTGTLPVHTLVSVLAAATGEPELDLGAALLPVLRDLVSRGFLLP